MTLEVETTGGALRGRERGGALLFAGIPYAAPPTGPLRFRPPDPHPGWTGVRDAQRFGAGAPQLPGQGMTASPIRWDEDCLTLNVCTPATDAGRRPVLVWIHGGAFRTGKGGIPWYDGSSFANRGDVVTVTINYRLGALGFAHLSDVPGAAEEGLVHSGLNGILDQIAALRWVRDNIHAFGGDPDRVAIAGESAGAMSVGTLLGCPQAAGLFGTAIAQSGAAHTVVPDAAARSVGRSFAEAAGAESIEALRALPAEQLLAAQAEVERRSDQGELEGVDRADREAMGTMPFCPAIDGDVLPEPPIEAVRRGLARDVRLVIGTNLHETALWSFGLADSARADRTADRLFGDDAPAALASYRGAHPNASDYDLMIAMTTDHAFGIPAVRLAEAQHEAGGTPWKYSFRWESRAFGGRLGACHALEIPFAFHTLEAPGVEAFLGEGPRPTGLADRMHAAWTDFLHGREPAGWPAYDPERRAVMEFGDRVGVLEDPFADVRRVWQGRR